MPIHEAEAFLQAVAHMGFDPDHRPRPTEIGVRVPVSATDRVSARIKPMAEPRRGNAWPSWVR